jgi:hypothetical protein
VKIGLRTLPEIDMESEQNPNPNAEQLHQDPLKFLEHVAEEDGYHNVTKKQSICKGNISYPLMKLTGYLDNTEADPKATKIAYTKLTPSFKKRYGDTKVFQRAPIHGHNHGYTHFVTRETVIDLLPFFKCEERKALVAKAWGLELEEPRLKRIEIEVTDGVTKTIQVSGCLKDSL